MIDISEARRAAARCPTLAPRGAEPTDIYLIHALADDELTAGVGQLIEEAGHSVRIDRPKLCESGDSSLPRDQVCIDEMRRCDAIFFACRPHRSPSARSAWQLGYFEALAAPRACAFLLPILEEGEIFAASGFLSRYPVVDLATYRPQKPSHHNWLRRLIGDQYPELTCRPPF